MQRYCMPCMQRMCGSELACYALTRVSALAFENTHARARTHTLLVQERRTLSTAARSRSASSFAFASAPAMAGGWLEVEGKWGPSGARPSTHGGDLRRLPRTGCRSGPARPLGGGGQRQYQVSHAADRAAGSRQGGRGYEVDAAR